MDYEDLLLEKKDGIATITLNVPEKLNALTLKMRRSLPLVMDEVARDDEVRVVIVTGAGRAFCAGGDVEAMKARFEGTLEEPRYELLRQIGYWSESFIRMDKLIIAAINGACVGAGFTMAMTCDFRIASETAKFGSLFIARALTPDCGLTYLLPRTVGISKALELMIMGELISAAEAERLGIVSRVVPPDELMKTARELAARIAQQPPIAVELTKKLVYKGMIGDISHHLDWETYGQRTCFQTEDHKESVRAFLEKRPQPQFKGK